MNETLGFTIAMRGYDRAEVEALHGRIERTLAGTAGADAVTADEVRSSQFRVTMRGYDLRQVDDYLDTAAAQLSTAAPNAPATGRGAAADSAPDDDGSMTSWADAVAERHALLEIAGREQGRRFPRGRFARGYDLAQVDAFVEHVRSTLTTTLTRAEVGSARFDVRRGGYREDEVDTWMSAVAAHTRS
ncbi:DivIVA domain-containing protein [Jiangella asiatica]|nr:DivIVA domain-containing protein [Jiangella asiatica]